MCLHQTLILGIIGSKDVHKTNAEDEVPLWGLQGSSSEFSVYDFSQVLEATGNFSEENKLGQGGFGPVHKVSEMKTQMHGSRFLRRDRASHYVQMQCFALFDLPENFPCFCMNQLFLCDAPV